MTPRDLIRLADRIERILLEASIDRAIIEDHVRLVCWHPEKPDHTVQDGSILVSLCGPCFDEMMDPLRGRPEVSFTPIEVVIAHAEELIRSSPLAQAEPIYAQLDQYYFRSAGDRGREPAARIREIIESKRDRSGSRGIRLAPSKGARKRTPGPRSE